MIIAYDRHNIFIVQATGGLRGVGKEVHFSKLHFIRPGGLCPEVYEIYMYVCMHVCMYVFMYVCMYECLHICMHISNFDNVEVKPSTLAF